MSGGTFDKLISIEQQSATRDTFNQKVSTWNNFAQIWARIEPLNGREFISRSGEAAKATHKITGWWIDGVLPSHRITYGARTFDILHVSSPQGREREIEMVCEERLT